MSLEMASSRKKKEPPGETGKPGGWAVRCKAALFLQGLKPDNLRLEKPSTPSIGRFHLSLRKKKIF
jgi:hypothetical protein